LSDAMIRGDQWSIKHESFSFKSIFCMGQS
jgi:hypothetical protein